MRAVLPRLTLISLLGWHMPVWEAEHARSEGVTEGIVAAAPRFCVHRDRTIILTNDGLVLAALTEGRLAVDDRVFGDLSTVGRRTVKVGQRTATIVVEAVHVSRAQAYDACYKKPE